MAEITLLTPTPAARRAVAAARRLRAEGKVPGVVYGHGMTPMSGHRRLARAARRRSPAPPASTPSSTSTSTATGVPGDRQGPAAPPGAPHRAARRLHPGQPATRRSPSSVPLVLEGEADGGRPATAAWSTRPRRHRARHHAAPTSPTSSSSTSRDLRDRRPSSASATSPLPAGVTTDVDPETPSSRCSRSAEDRRDRGRRRRGRPRSRPRPRGRGRRGLPGEARGRRGRRPSEESTAPTPTRR